MKENLVYIIFMIAIMGGYFIIFGYFLYDYIKLKNKVQWLKRDLRALEEDHGIFKGDEKE